MFEREGNHLTKRFVPYISRNIEAKATPSYITTDGEITLQQRVEHLGILADDAESRDKRLEAAARHDDRIEAATAAATAHPGESSIPPVAYCSQERYLVGNTTGMTKCKKLGGNCISAGKTENICTYDEIRFQCDYDAQQKH